MNGFFIFNLILALPIQGILWITLLALLSFVGVHITALAKLGWRYKNSLNRSDTPHCDNEKAPAEHSQAPIYYIVEKKKGKPKGDYGKPKPFQFKEN